MQYLTLPTLLLALAPLAHAASSITASTINGAQASSIASLLTSYSSDHTSDFISLASYVSTATDMPATVTNSWYTQTGTSYSDIMASWTPFRDGINSVATAKDSYFDGLPPEVSSYYSSLASAEVSIINKVTENEAAGMGVRVGLWAAAMVGAGVGIVLM